ncbi:YceI family protein [Deinococcus hopiensis]|uniref:Polyisoprenoid-binding protein YceI n=1 Tax=Deinococcus hopiensis KR-140 TaxID=695939 RepID=A0A1W1UHJ1_9DEIO|nr:YceI family protein [Deinococcus hopiensis]SMB80224.1 Polyisoprenoid-binding protein YceI [Deinococcus hopiensis KR-140]
MSRFPAARLLLLALLAAPTALAAPVKFEVATKSENLNVLTVESETAVENFTARTNKVSGTLTFDPASKTGGGTVTIDGTTIDTGIALRNRDMKSATWLNFDKQPDVKFTATKVAHLSGEKYRVSGNLTMNGVTRPVTADATVRYTPEGDLTRAVGLKGDVLAVSVKFGVKLSDYGVKHPQIAAGRVSNDLDLVVRFIASSK